MPQYSAHKQAHDQENQNQREKLEGELKKEIKKLQRLREQIKGWIAGADIKDKQPLIDARKSIERDMERFKACEMEAKAKGSAAGGADRDSTQRAKDEARDWIKTVVDQLTEKVESMEAEMEELQVTVKKRQKPPVRLTSLEETVGRHKDHIDRLEKVLRCIDNETIQPDELSDLKEEMDLYLLTTDDTVWGAGVRCGLGRRETGGEGGWVGAEATGDEAPLTTSQTGILCAQNTEDGEDMGMDLSNVDDMYGMFQDRLDAVDNAAPAAPLHSVKHGKGGREKEAEEAREKERERERAAAAAAKAQLIAQAGGLFFFRIWYVRVVWWCVRQGNTNLKLHDEDEVRKPLANASSVGAGPGNGVSVSGGSVGAAAGGKPSTPVAAPPATTTAAAGPGLPLAVPPLAAPQPSVGPSGSRQTAPSTPAKEPDSGTATPRTATMAPSTASPGLSSSEAASPMPPGGGAVGTPHAAGPVLGPMSLGAHGQPPPPPPPPPPPGMALAGGGPARTPTSGGPTANGGGGGAGGMDGGGGVPRWLAAAASGGPAGGSQGSEAPHSIRDLSSTQNGAGPGPRQGPASASSAAAAAATAGGGGGGGGFAATGPGTAGTPSGTADGGGGGGPLASSAAAAAAGRQPTDRGPAAGPSGPSGMTDALTARMAGVVLGGSGAANANVNASSAGAGPGSRASSAGGMGLSPQSAAAAAAASSAGSAGGGGGLLLPGDLPPVVPAYSVSAAKQILEACYARGVIPHLSDTEWKHTRPRHPVAVPASYPKTAPEVVDNPALFRKMDPECLFFAFYFQPNTYQQFLAAHELKRQSWRFHRHHNAWFQRFTEPAVTSEEYEQGAYVYFDYNIVHDDMQTGWCYRRKENFTFRYDALEDELRVANLTPQQTVAMAMAQVQGL
ncbi:hypothetical protein VOLCADRAFT_92540 [Volvox carteri f. nagariensis]|uniref:NOT2/NOT3/NOT5 C-terminal domain-containing protein n=1 Tax=Volvox carteri f. nagariensis TaxID=3068 RepID=D8TZX7_VOLCA|nr:uncharacterized protein VOLCADRAFT_92540 [Volvox carteri f. nagariensis]EFJ47006.1 hypothetical protein VOLCADRAFT_92540 [Volvox carteri f. nagariensis]|eukprot:XP_002951901.1 hypothetical protein VOLCADRAFT_92540 [Volvox carteri f. nagariensis]